MRLRTIARRAVPLTLLSAGLGCTEPVSLQPPGEVSISISVMAASATVVGITAEITGPGIDEAIRSNLVDGGSGWSATIDVPAGSDRLFVLRAFDAKGIETHRGEATADIHEGANALVDLTLAPLIGDQQIDATIGTFTVILTPVSAVATVGGQIDFDAEVQDVDGNPVAGAVLVWASTNPGIAEVDDQGVATGNVAGTVRIVANYRGFAGAADLTVQ